MGISTINPLERITPRCACRSHSPIITAKVQRFLSQPFFVWDSEFWKLNRFIRTNRKAQATIFSSKAVDFSQSYHFGATSHGHNTMSRGCGDFHRHTWSLCGFGNHHQRLRGGRAGAIDLLNFRKDINRFRCLSVSFYPNMYCANYTDTHNDFNIFQLSIILTLVWPILTCEGPAE